MGPAADTRAMDLDAVLRHLKPVPRYTSYPTAPHFRPEIGPETYRRWLGAIGEGSPLSLYLHVPFCERLCRYCGCHTKITRRYDPISAYVEALLAEIGLVGAAIGGRPQLRHLHWGGGTPTILSPADFRRLAAAIGERFERASGAEHAIEIDPRTLEPEMVDALAEAGVTRASLGVQDVNPEIQVAIDREQPVAVTALAVERLRAAGIARINLDLMYGLPGQTEAHVVETIDQMAALAPDRLALFGYAHVPWMKTHQRLIDEAALPDLSERLRQIAAAAERLARHGYVAVGLDHYARPDDPLAQAQGEARLRRNFQGYTDDAAPALIGLGASAIGSLAGGYVQNAPPINVYEERVAAGELATARGLALSDEDRLRRDIIEQLMCTLAVDLDQVAAAHGRTEAGFEPELQSLASFAAAGLIAIDDRRIAVPDAARPLIRTVCAVFDQYLSDGGPARHSAPV